MKTKKLSRGPRIYVASPLGFSEAGRYFYKKKFLPMLFGLGFKVLDPWTLTPRSHIDCVARLPLGQRQRTAWEKMNIVIGNNNVVAILKCDLVVAILDGQEMDSGTASEIGFAAGVGKVIFGYRGDFRMSGENIGAVVNLQVERFIRGSGGTIQKDLKTLKKELRRYLKARVRQAQ